MTFSFGQRQEFQHYACEAPDKPAAWAARTAERLSQLGDKIKAGTLQHVVTTGSQRGTGLAPKGEKVLCGGFQRGRTAGQILETLKKMAAQWAS